MTKPKSRSVDRTKHSVSTGGLVLPDLGQYRTPELLLSRPSQRTGPSRHDQLHEVLKVPTVAFIPPNVWFRHCLRIFNSYLLEFM